MSMRPWILWGIGACGLVFIGGIFGQLVVPSSVLIWVGLPFGLIGALLARVYVMSRR